MIDTHVHLDHPRFKESMRQEILNTCRQSGISKLIIPAITMETNEEMRKMFDDIPWIYYVAGVHPGSAGLDCDEGKDGFLVQQLDQYASAKKTVAIGETGLDFYREHSEHGRYRQQIWFHRSLEIAEKHKLPVVLHIRDAEEEAMKILQQYRLKDSGVVHCFGGDWEIAQRYLERGLYLGIGGRITRPGEDRIREALGHIPMERILLETDAPFQKPEGATGVNTPLNLHLIAEKIAEIKGISVEEVKEITTENARRLFRI